MMSASLGLAGDTFEARTIESLLAAPGALSATTVAALCASCPHRCREGGYPEAAETAASVEKWTTGPAPFAKTNPSRSAG
jgi:hypothetical protein